MLIYLGLFFIIPDKFRSGKYLPITLSVGILGACLGLYGIWKVKQVPENFRGVGEACGASRVMCGSDDTSGAPSQLYQITTPVTSQAAGLAMCRRYGGVLASLAQVSDAYNNGASMQMWAWVSDGPTHQGFPVRNNSLNAYYSSATIMSANTGTNCWGPKPPPSTPNVRPWTDRANTVNGVAYTEKDWSRKNSAGTPLATMQSSPIMDYCLINMRTLPNSSVDQSVVFNMFGRYVRVMSAASLGDGYFHMSQVMVYNANGTNVAQGKPTSAISTHPHAGATSLLVDGTTTPRGWNNIWHNNTNNRADYWQVDLGSVQMITSVRIISRGDCCTNRIQGIRIVVLSDPDLEVPTTGSCIPTPTPVYPAGTTTAEQVKLRNIILGAMDGQKALNVLRGIQSNTATNLTNYGLTDSQAAAAYNKLFVENLNFRRAGWQFSASWTPGTNTLTVTGGVPPIVNMTVKTAKGIAVGARVTAVSGNTVTLDRNTDAGAGTGKYVLPTGAVDQTVQTNGYKGRYVRLRPSLISGDGWVQVSQVVVKDAAGTNIARGKPVFTTSVRCEGGGCFQQGSVTVDGVLTPRSGANVWQPMTGNRTTEYMEVDLGSEVAISSIQVQGRPDCCNGIHGNDRMTGMRIEINQTARAADTTAPTIANQLITMNGDMNDASYFSNSNSVRNMQTVASITYDRAGTLADYMKWNKGSIAVPVLDSAGNPVLNSGGIPTMNTITDNGETAATSIIMSVTKVEAIDPAAVDSGATKATTRSPDGVSGYNIPAAPNTSNWSETSLSKIPQQTAAINLGSQAPIVINLDTTDAQIAAQATGSFRISPPPVSQAVMDGGATNTASSAGYTAPRQNEGDIAGANGAEKEVFIIGNPSATNGPWFGSREAARQACVAIGADGLATLQQLREAHAAGAQWCLWGWLTDAQALPWQQGDGCIGQGAIVSTHGGNGDGATCWGYKPSKNHPNASRTRAFSDRANNVSWNRKSAINTLVCPAGKTRISCNGADACLNSGTSCGRSCPSGTTLDTNRNECKP